MIEILEKKELKCFHCGDTCADESIHLDNKLFCCNGCKTVFEILNENSMCDYYSLENTPGNKAAGKSDQEYAYLDDPKIQAGLLNFKEGTVSGITFQIPSIHCSSCIWLLENLKKIKPGIVHTSIVFQKKVLEVQYDSEKVKLSELAGLLDSLGYPPLITLDGKPVNRKSVGKTLLYKIGIAGFCFGNIMLLSMSEYVSFLGDFTGELKTFFSYISLVLSLPVFFYCASDYFTAGWNAIRNRVINIDLPIAMALAAAFLQSLIEIITHTGMGYLDSLTGLIFFLLIGKWYQRKTYDALSFDRDYKSYFPLAATVVKDGKEQFVALNELKPGDQILIRNQDVIPADAILREGNGRIDYSFVTGESAPLRKKAGERIFAGGRQEGESIRLEVVKKVSESYLTQLWNKDRSGKESFSPLSVFTNKVGTYFTIAIFLVSALSYVYWYSQDPSRALHAAITVLIVFCPCTLALAIPFCFGNAMNILSRNGFYLKNAEVIERLADNDTIVFDKTGTITNAGEAEIEFEGFLTPEELQYVKSMVKNSSHPLSRMLNSKLSEVKELKLDLFEETPSKGLFAEVNGCHVKVGSPEFVGIESGMTQKNASLVMVSINDQVKACYTFKNKYRTGIDQVLNRLEDNYTLHLLSGDNDAEKNRLSGYFPKGNIYFNQTPLDKLSYIQQLEINHKTIMVGDGLNDAGALMESNCGISISESGGNFSPACDVILEAKRIEKLPDFIAYARTCVRIVRISLFISLLYNCIGLYFACQGILKPLTAAILMPLSSVSIVLFVTFGARLWAKRYGLK